MDSGERCFGFSMRNELLCNLRHISAILLRGKPASVYSDKRFFGSPGRQSASLDSEICCIGSFAREPAFVDSEKYFFCSSARKPPLRNISKTCFFGSKLGQVVR